MAVSDSECEVVFGSAVALLEVCSWEVWAGREWCCVGGEFTLYAV